MEFFNEKQSTQRATMRSIEVNYVNADARDFDTTGVYQFALPARWTSHASMNKAIGLRRLRYAPWSGSIGFYAHVYDSDDALHLRKIGPLKFTSENNLPECIVAIEEAATWAEDGITYTCYINYDGTTINMNFKDEDDVSLKFKLEFDSTLHQSSDNLLMLFNQEITTANTTKITSEIAANSTITFDGVWNRADLYFHASFSDSTRQIIGTNNDFWTHPSVFYDGSRTSDDFVIRFTQDTVTEIIPRHGVLLIQLSLIYNHMRYID